MSETKNITTNRYRQRRVEIAVVDKERLWSDHIGRIWLSKWHFNKRRIVRDGDGEISFEQPFEETVFSLSKSQGRKWCSVWLNADEMRDLKTILDMQEELG
jgi:hypothetical protein